MTKYTNTEDLANRIIEELAKLNEPIVFKGAMTLHYSIRNDNPSEVSRRTKDIDGDYTNTNVTMKKLWSIINKAVSSINPELEVCTTREFSEKRSANFVIYKSMDKLLSIDLSVRENPFYRIYLSFNDVPIRGATESKMVADKIVTISTRLVFRRTKDLVDLYILSLSGKIFNTIDIVHINRNFNRQIGDFCHFKNSVDEIQYAYDKLREVENKPRFDILYEQVFRFVKPFMSNLVPDLNWFDNDWKI
ncbi:MAG: hypothetical protein IKZ53_01355 [Selenomonadaceae bacterium]|nr:hypothetical protein [Selenomonadaceae bacterium]